MSKQSAVGIIDIGSNSVRLVIYDRLHPHAVELHNEKIFCELGRDLNQTGTLHPEGKQRALRAMQRFRYLCDGLHANNCLPFATAAVRAATDGDAFLKEAEAALGTPIQLLSGDEEARYSARGALMHVEITSGLICDMGGGSLEIAYIDAKGMIQETCSLPLGGLLVKDAMATSRKSAKQYIRTELQKAEALLAKGDGKPLYLVGGGLRALARLHMAHTGYALKLLHHYHVKAKGFKSFCRQVSHMRPDELDVVPEISRRRQQVIPACGLLMKELLKASHASSITVSTSGVREGIFWEHIPIAHRLRPNLADELADMSPKPSKVKARAERLLHWLAPLKAHVNEKHWQELSYACLMLDADAHDVMVFRADMAFLHMLYASLPRLTHQMRAMLAMIIFHRHRYTSDYPLPNWPIDGITEHDMACARFMGTAMQLACHLAPGDAGGLNHLQLEFTNHQWQLTIASTDDITPIIGDSSRKRLDRLNRAYGYYVEG